MESVGKSTSKDQLRMLSSTARRLYLPMYFFFCSTRGSVSSALNLIGAQFQKATIDLSLNSLVSVIEDGEDSGGFISKNATPGTSVHVIDEISTDTMTAPVRADDGDIGVVPKGLLTAYTGARVTLDVLGITLNEDDRNVFSTKDRMSLMDEVTVISRTGSQALTKDEVISITDHAKNLIYELQIAARVRKARSRKTDSSNPYVAQGPLRFDGMIDATTGLTSEPLGTLSLTISGQQRTQQNLEAAFYNRVTPYMHHSTLPSAKGIYSMPFSLYPEDWNVPDSYANASKLDSMRLQIGLPKEVAKQASLGNNGGVDVQIFCHTFNVLVEQKGMKARFFV
jgi:hypothetical protein